MGADFDDWLTLVEKGKKDLTDINELVGVDPSQKMTFNGKHLTSLIGPIARHHWTSIDSTAGLTPPLQPMWIMFEGKNLTYEPLIYDWVNVFSGTGGFRFDGTILGEGYHYTEASQTHGNMLQKLTFQRTQAKEYLMSVQNIKTAILNIEGDLEKIDEQMKAFNDGDWESIKSLFIDNYGGPQRSWNAIARNVPLVRMALTWFLRLKVKYTNDEKMPIKEFSKLKLKRNDEDKTVKTKTDRINELKETLEIGAKDNKKAMLEEIDELVKGEQMNPAIANYLKRKAQEFWNWVITYTDWLIKSQNQIKTNLVQQKANLKLYMTWAADHIKQADRLKMSSNLASNLPEFGFKGSPREVYTISHMFSAGLGDRPDIAEFTAPYVPVIFSTFFGGTTVEVQNKFTEGAFRVFYGSMRSKHVERIKKLVKHEKEDFLQTMLTAGAVTEDEIPKLFDKREIEQFQLKPMKKDKPTSSFYKNSIQTLEGFLSVFGLSLPKENFDWTKDRRAQSIAAELAQKGITNFKKAHGMLLNK